MQIKSLVAAAVLAVGASAGFAADQTVSFDNGLAQFKSTDVAGPVLAGGDDVITFDNLTPGSYDFLLTLEGQYINLGSITLNGVEGSIYRNGRVLFADVEGSSGWPFTLTLTGSPKAGGLAGYSGTLQVTAVPEPETYALLLAGLLGIGFVARRRSV
jgi:hypothetical protein